MIEILVGLVIVLQIAIILYLFRNRSSGNTAVDLEKLDKLIKDESDRNRKSSNDSAKALREEINNGLKRFGDSLDKRIFQLGEAVETRLGKIQKDNTVQLEKMRETVDEKLQSTLEKRLSESFKQVSTRLEMVHKGLGEMQELATGVGDLKKVLTNVKTRGTWGEIQLDGLLEQILSQEQFSKNVAIKPGVQERVDFAIKIPSKDAIGKDVLLPIDAKFPIEDYRRLVKAADNGDKEQVQLASKALEQRIKDESKKIKEKYIEPPFTTDFAIL